MRPLPLAPLRCDYVSLGDTLSTDAPAGGPGRGAASLLLKNRDEDFPLWRGRDLSSRFPGARRIPLALDGATAATVRFVQLPRLKELGVVPTIATLTVGSADLWRTRGELDLIPAAHAAFAEHLRAALTDLRRMGGDRLWLAVGTLPDPSDGTGDLLRAGVFAAPEAWGWLESFNRTVRASAAECGALVADLHAAFLGHGLRAGNPSEEEPRPVCRELYLRRDVSPTAWGADAIRALWWSALEERGGKR